MDIYKLKVHQIGIGTWEMSQVWKTKESAIEAASIFLELPEIEKIEVFQPFNRKAQILEIKAQH